MGGGGGGGFAVLWQMKLDPMTTVSPTPYPPQSGRSFVPLSNQISNLKKATYLRGTSAAADFSSSQAHDHNPLGSRHGACDSRLSPSGNSRSCAGHDRCRRITTTRTIPNWRSDAASRRRDPSRTHPRIRSRRPRSRIASSWHCRANRKSFRKDSWIARRHYDHRSLATTARSIFRIKRRHSAPTTLSEHSRIPTSPSRRRSSRSWWMAGGRSRRGFCIVLPTGPFRSWLCWFGSRQRVCSWLFPASVWGFRFPTRGRWPVVWGRSLIRAVGPPRLGLSAKPSARSDAGQRAEKPAGDVKTTAQQDTDWDSCTLSHLPAQPSHPPFPLSTHLFPVPSIPNPSPSPSFDSFLPAPNSFLASPLPSYSYPQFLSPFSGALSA